MKIAMYSRVWTDHGLGGMQIAARDTAYVLSRLGHEVHVFTTGLEVPFPQEKEDEGITLHFANSPKGKYTTEYFDQSYRKFLDVGGFDIVYSHSSAARRHLGKELPVVAHWHGIGSQQDAINLRKIGMSCEDKNFDKDVLSYPWHIAIAPHEAELIVENGGDPKRIRVIHAGREDFFPRNREYSRANLGVGRDQFCVGLVGRLVTDKGISQVLDILDSLPDSVVILAIGEGPYFHKLSQHPRVICRHKEAPELMPQYYSAMDLYLNPTTRHQGFDLTTIEAALCGCKLLLSEVGSYRKVFPEASFFEVGNLDSLMGGLFAEHFQKIQNLERFHLDYMGKAIHEFLGHIRSSVQER
jgi:glycosyltransferase involved in cell wall biosynthesis